MPQGQFTGPKASYIYRSDNGTPFAILRDTDLALTDVTGLEPYTEGSEFAFSLPRRFQPRGVHWLGYIGDRPVRKFLICGSLNSTLYVTESSAPITIDGVVGYTTGKRGERSNYIRRTRQVAVP